MLVATSVSELPVIPVATCVCWLHLICGFFMFMWVMVATCVGEVPVM